MQDFMEGYMDDEAEETLSLCDLATQKDDHAAAEWEDFSRESLQMSGSISCISSSQEQEDGFFEFFSEDWSTNSNPFPPENIIFCGKPIGRYIQPRPDSDTIEPHESNRRRAGLLRWSSDSLPKPKASNKRYGPKNNRRQYSSLPKQTHETKKLRNDCDLSVHHQKMSILTSSASKSRWYLLFFGSMASRVPTGMELSSIKSRQSRQSPSSSPLFKLRGDDQEVNNNACRKKTNKGLWGLIRVLGCVNHHHATSIKASIRGVPRVEM